VQAGLRHRREQPAVLSATVLPPVFGPAMISTRVGGVISTSTGTAFDVSSGCRAARSSNAPSGAIIGSTPPVVCEKRARA
jgi:hypothetical protein